MPLQHGICKLHKCRLLLSAVLNNGDSGAGEDIGSLFPEQWDGATRVDVRVVMHDSVRHLNCQDLFHLDRMGIVSLSLEIWEGIQTQYHTLKQLLSVLL